MADKKFSQFTVKTTLNGSEKFVGHASGDNIQADINTILNYIGANISGFIFVYAVESDWQTANPILPEGFHMISSDDMINDPKFKISDGVSTWADLPYFSTKSLTSPDGFTSVEVFNSIAVIHASDGTLDCGIELSPTEIKLREPDITVSTPLMANSNKSIKSLTAAVWGAFILALNNKAIPSTSDSIILSDSVASGVAKKTNLLGVRGIFKTYYDSLYATIASVNLKEDKVNKVTNFTSPNNTDFPTTQATINLVDSRIQSNIKIIGDWDATSGSMPLADESNTTPFISQWGATIKVGWAFRVGYGQAGTVGGFDYEEGDVVYALIDNAGPTPADWGDLDHNLQQATEILRGTSKVITAVIIADETTTDDERFVTGKKLWLNFWTRVLAIAHTFAAKITFTTAPRFDSTTASERLEVDGNKDLISVPKGTADNKNFGTGTSNIVEIGATLGNNLPVVTNALGKITTSDWVDYSATSTLVGWASTTNKVISYIDMGAYYIYRFYISGTSNAITTSFTIHATENVMPINEVIIRITNNATLAAGLVRINLGSNTVQVYANPSLGGWTGTAVPKIVSGTFNLYK